MGKCCKQLIVAGVITMTPMAGPSDAADRFITLASTTSTENSGLFRYLLPKFTTRTGVAVRVVAVGTGAALRLGLRGDADVVLVHAPEQEKRFVAAGHGVGRQAVMHNDFVIVGPKSDPAGIRGVRSAVKALSRLYQARALFASRGDKSGTHTKECSLWKSAHLDPQKFFGRWYLETGSGMGATLNFATARSTYTLADRASWLAFKNKRDLVLMVEGDKRLANPYGIIVVNPAKHSGVKDGDATMFVDWLTGEEGQAAIGAFRINGNQVFFPNGKL